MADPTLNNTLAIILKLDDKATAPLKKFEKTVSDVAQKIQVQYIFHGPWIHPHFKKEVIYRQIECIHHSVFTLIHNPQRLFIMLQKLRTSVVASYGMVEHEFSCIRKVIICKLFIINSSSFFYNRKMLQCIVPHILDRCKVTLIPVSCFKSSGYRPGPEKTYSQAKSCRVSRRYLK